MHFSTIAALALPLLANAQGPFDQYVAQFQNVLGSIGSKIPNPSRHDPVGAAEAKLGEMKLHILTVDNFKDTLYAPVKAQSTTPEDWWILITGGNKTCFGRCEQVEKAFNQTAAKLAVLPNAPYIGYLNCDDQPVLCNAISAPTSAIWNIEMLPPPAPINVWSKRLNVTTTTSDDILNLYKNKGNRGEWYLKEGIFHPFDGQLAQYGLAIPLGYLLWALSVIPSWGMMLIVSFASRSMMNRRMGPQPGGPAPAGRPRGAPAGDATS